MRKSILIPALVVSIGGNVALTSAYFGRPTTQPNVLAQPSPGETGSVPAKAVQSGGIVSGSPAPAAAETWWAYIESMRGKLEAEGYPAAVVKDVISSLAKEKIGYHESEAEAKKGGLEAYEAWNKEISAKLVDVLPGWAETLQRLEEDTRSANALRYGGLSTETVEAVQKLARDQSKATERDFAVALGGLLTPAQVEDYLRYHSVLARNIQETIAAVDVDEETYFALLDAAIQREGSIAPDALPGELAKRQFLPASVATYRRVLGDERFVRIINRIDPTTASVDAVYQVAGLSPALRADLFIEAFEVRQAGGRSPETARLREHLISRAGLTPEQVAGFDRMRLGVMLARGDLGPWSPPTVGR